MPTVLRVDGFRIVIYPNDHLPPHVHAIHADGEARISLLPVVRLLSVEGLGLAAARAAMAIVNEHRFVLMRHWSAIHG